MAHNARILQEAFIHAKNGDLFLVEMSFSIWDWRSWLRPFIKFFTNLWNSGEWVPYHHCGIVWQGGIHEAKANGVFLTPWQAYVNGRRGKVKSVAVLRAVIPMKDMNEGGRRYINSTTGSPYDYVDVILSQAVYQLTNKRVWLGKRQAADLQLYCSEHCAEFYNHSQPEESILKPFPDSYWISPFDLYQSGFFKTIYDSHATR